MGMLALIAVGAMVLPILKSHYAHKKAIAMTMSFAVLMSTVGLYGYWGAYGAWTDKLALGRITETLEILHATPGLNRQKIIQDLKKKKKGVSHSAPALAQLGDIYTQLGLLTQATQAWDKVIILAPGNAAYRMPWLYSHALCHQGKLPPHVREKAEGWAQSSPPERSVLNILAMDDYFQGNYDRAIQAWTLLLAMDSELPIARQQVLNNAIHMARLKKNNNQ